MTDRKNTGLNVQRPHGKIMSVLTQKYLHKILHYNSNTGVFTWVQSRRGIRVGNIAGCITNGSGYVYIKINHKNYYAHRLAWFYIYGVWPAGLIDHINGVRDDNRLINLREATYSENNRNSSTPKTNTSGIKGVRWYERIKKWGAQCMVNRRTYYLGYFTDVSEAEQAVKQFREEYHREFANHGIQIKEN